MNSDAEIEKATSIKMLNSGLAPMNKKIVFTKKAPIPTLPLSQAVIAGHFIYVSGTVGADPVSGNLVTGGFEAQAERVFHNIREILEAAGSTLEDVIKVNAYLKDRKDFKVFNEIYSRYFDHNPPARTTIQSTMVYDSILVEVDCIAHRPNRAKSDS